MKARSCKAVSLFASAKGTEIFGRLGNHVRPKFHHNASSRLAANGHVKVTLGIGPIYIYIYNIIKKRDGMVDENCVEGAVLEQGERKKNTDAVCAHDD
jgi:hypothetical protein